ncbi:MAG: SRPBCC family protein [Caulobacteraceae bacterium]|nr:MAG: SRPBCC family protein [Caulobacteraceae bacterium]
MAFRDVRFVHIDIAAPPAAVAAYLRDARKLPDWAPNFGDQIRPDGDNWIMRTRTGPFRVRMVQDNDLGVADHWVTPPGGGGELHNAIRVTENGAGSLVVFNLYRQDGFDDARFDEDEALVLADLRRLKVLIEGEA